MKTVRFENDRRSRGRSRFGLLRFARNDRTAGLVIVALLLSFVTTPAWCAPLDLSDIAVGAPALPQGYESPKDLQYANKRGLIRHLELKDVKISDDILIEKNVAYGKAGVIVLPLDLYRPKQVDRPVPGLIFIHGGGWASGDKEFYAYWAAHGAERGYVCASIEYRKSDVAPFPAAVEDCKCAVRWMRANAAKYNVNPDQIGVMGNSAGGHLAMMVAYSSQAAELEGGGGWPDVSSNVQAVIDIYGPVDMTAENFRAIEPVVKFLGKPFDEMKEQYQKASPIRYLAKGAPPTLILHGSIDSIVPIDQAESLAKKLKELGVSFFYDRQEGWDHGMDLFREVSPRCMYIEDRFLDKVLPLPKRGEKQDGTSERISGAVHAHSN